MKTIGKRMCKGGNIINIASVSGMKGEEDFPMYAATKAGLINMTKSFAIGYAPNVRVNCISPGFFNTNLVEGDAPAELIKHIPMGYEAEPSAIIPAIEFILKADYLTGENIVLDGGLTA